MIVVDTETRSIIATVTGLLDPNGVAVSPDGSRVYVVDGVARTVQVVGTDTNTTIATIQDVFGTRGVAVSPDGSRVYVVLERVNGVGNQHRHEHSRGHHNGIQRSCGHLACGGDQPRWCIRLPHER